jgi:hypothetical protein
MMPGNKKEMESKKIRNSRGTNAEIEDCERNSAKI